jgi:hypothetical protein
MERYVLLCSGGVDASKNIEPDALHCGVRKKPKGGTDSTVSEKDLRGTAGTFGCCRRVEAVGDAS